MTDLELQGKRVLIREDLNVPIKNGIITSDARILAAIPTIEYALKAGARVILMSHLGRPIEGNFNEQYSIKPIARYIQELLKVNITVTSDREEKIFNCDSDIIFLENVRFNEGEKTNSQSLSKSYASLCDIFVMDAFGAAHRSQASTYGVAKYAPISCAGPLLVRELNVLDKILKQPARPMVAIVGGSKVSSKLAVLKKLADKVDQLIVGGGIANTFLALVKDTPLIFVVGLLELAGMIGLAKTNPKWLGMAIEGYVFAGLVFWVICYAMSRYSQRLEKRLSTER